MMTSQKKRFRVTALCEGGFPSQRTSNAWLWRLFNVGPKVSVKHTVYKPVIWNVRSFMWRHCFVVTEQEHKMVNFRIDFSIDSWNIYRLD